jgi:hypothetical protein
MAFNPPMLSHFTGAEHYYRLNRQCLVTDGAKYLADEADAYWLLVAIPKFAIQLLLGSTDIYTLSKKMGNSAAMIEQHYSKLTATIAADRLA